MPSVSVLLEVRLFATGFAGRKSGEGADEFQDPSYYKILYAAWEET